MEDKILLYTQPANSPDVNINDLGFFRALQAYYERFSPNDAGEIITYIQEAYKDYDYKRINRIYLTLMGVYNEIIDCNGDNIYKLPHMNKDQLERIDQLPTVLKVTDNAFEHLQEQLEELA